MPLPLPHRKGSFYAWCAKQPCAVCLAHGATMHGVELHHVLLDPTLPRKTHALREYTIIPLCTRHHRHGRDAAHRWVPQGDNEGKGQAGWLAYHRLDLPAVLLRQYHAYAAAHGVALAPGLTPRQAAEHLCGAGTR